ncbi:hypothetical protein T439DRAFT_356521 [Meredithblackwellia eburnea MCA 4105]
MASAVAPASNSNGSSNGLRRKPSSLRLQRSNSNCSLKSPSPLSMHITLPSPTALPGSIPAGPPGDASNAFETPPSTPPCNTLFNPLFSNSLSLVPPPGPGGQRRQLTRRNSTLSIASSLASDDGMADEDDGDDSEWTESEKEKLKRTVDSYLAAASTAGSPFSGAPPSNLTHVIARAIVNNKSADSGSRILRSSTRNASRAAVGGSETSSATAVNLGAPVAISAVNHDSEDQQPQPQQQQKWRHGIKSTRLKILAMVREREVVGEATPKQGDVDATPKRRKHTIHRNNSMDFLPNNRNVGIVARLGSKLHRAEQGPPPSASSHHPYNNNSRPGRLVRTNSLSSIAGSPTQPPAKATRPSLAPPSSAAASSSRMLRVASEGTPKMMGGSSQAGLMFNFTPTPLSSIPAPSATSGGGLLSPMLSTVGAGPSNTIPPPSSSSRNSRNVLGLGLDITPTKGVASGLKSAFHSPVVGAYPSPESLKKKRTKKSHSLPFPSTPPVLSSAQLNSSPGGMDVDVDGSHLDDDHRWPTVGASADGESSPSPMMAQLEAFPFPSIAVTHPTPKPDNGRWGTGAGMKRSRANFYLGHSHEEQDSEDSSSATFGSFGSTTSSVCDSTAETTEEGEGDSEDSWRPRTRRLNKFDSAASLTSMDVGTPSPTTSTFFKLDELSLHPGPGEDGHHHHHHHSGGYFPQQGLFREVVWGQPHDGASSSASSASSRQ